MNSVIGFNVGDIVHVRLGDNAGMLSKCRYVLINTRITAINTGTRHHYALDPVDPYAINVTGAAAGNKIVEKFAYVCRDVLDQERFNFECLGTVGVERHHPCGLLASDILIENIQGNKSSINMVPACHVPQRTRFDSPIKLYATQIPPARIKGALPQLRQLRFDVTVRTRSEHRFVSMRAIAKDLFRKRHRPFRG